MDYVPFGRGLLQMLGTAVAFGLLSKVAEFFSESYGASFVFPPAGLSLAAKESLAVGTRKGARPDVGVGACRQRISHSTPP